MAHVFLLLSVFCFSFISLSTSLRHSVGKCEPITAKPGLDINKLAGQWIRYAKYGLHYEGFTKPQCTKVELNVGQQGNEISLVQTKIFTTFKRDTVVEESKLKPDTNGLFTKHPVHVDSSASDEVEKKRIFTILDTDYECWVATYECKQKNSKLHVFTSEVKSYLWVKKSDKCMQQEFTHSYLHLLNRELGSTITTVTSAKTSGC